MIAMEQDQGLKLTPSWASYADWATAVQYALDQSRAYPRAAALDPPDRAQPGRGAVAGDGYDGHPAAAGRGSLTERGSTPPQ